MRGVVVIGGLAAFATVAQAQPPAPAASRPGDVASDGTMPVEPPPAAEPDPASGATSASIGVPGIAVHGFVSEGGFLSTSNDYIGESSRGTLKLFEAAVNVTTEVAEGLRAGVQLFAREVGALRDESPRIDWAFVDYRWDRWLGLRAGIIKMPFGLYNEYVDIDSARVAILMPQSVYPIRNRDVLLSHTGFALYGDAPLGAAGALEYQAWLGTLNVPRNALDLEGATLEAVDTRYVTGGQLFWRPPVDGLRVGASVLRASIDFHLKLTPDTVAQLVALELVPADFDGSLVVSQRPDKWWVVSAELIRGQWLLAAEYGRAYKHQVSTLPDLLPTLDEVDERFYAMVNYRLARRVEIGTYGSVHHLDAHDRRGRGDRFVERFHAFQRDLAASLRLDVNEHWLWKLEAHLIDGTADLPALANRDPERTWGLFLVRTTVTF